MGVWDWITHRPTYEEVRMWDMDSFRYNVVVQLLKVHGGDLGNVMVEGNPVAGMMMCEFEKYGGSMPTKTMELTGYCSFTDATAKG